MELKKVAEIVDAIVVAGIIDNCEVETGFSSDLMSDVLTLDSESMLLVTGLANVQTIRTAEMADIQNILLVRNKKATPEMIELANENGMVLMESAASMFRATGILFNAGLKPVY